MESAPNGMRADVNAPTCDAALEQKAAKQLAPELELLQLGHEALSTTITFVDDDKAMVLLPSGRSIDVVRFIVHSFAMLKEDPRKALNPHQAHNVGIFFEFFAHLTILFDENKFPKLSALPTIMLRNEQLRNDVVEVIVDYVRNLNMSTQRNHRLDALTNTSNQLTVLQNYISYELARHDRPFCKRLAGNEHLIAFINETMHLIRVQSGDRISETMRASFRKHLIEFWNAVVHRRVLTPDVYNRVLLFMIRQEDISMVVGYLLSEIEKGAEQPLHFFKLLVESSDFRPSMRRESWRGLREKYLTLTLNRMLTLLEGAKESSLYAIGLMETLVDLLADQQFEVLLMASNLHRDLLLQFFSGVIERHASLFTEVEQRAVAQRFAVALHALFSYLSAPKGAFNALLSERLTTVTVLQHLERFRELPLLKDAPMLTQNDRDDFDELIERIRRQQQEMNVVDVDVDVDSVAKAVQRYLDASDLQIIVDNEYVSPLPMPTPDDDDDDVDDVNAQLAHYTTLKASSKAVVPFLDASNIWRVKAAAPIPAGAFVLEYTGEVTSTERFRRNPTSRDATHVLRLGRRRYDDLVLDARRKGSLARCLAPTARAAANCELQLHVVGAHPHLLVFTRKAIVQDEELTLDYAELLLEEYRTSSPSSPARSSPAKMSVAAAPTVPDQDPAPTDATNTNINTNPSAPAPAPIVDAPAPPPAPSAPEAPTSNAASSDEEADALLQLANVGFSQAKPSPTSSGSSTATNPSSPVQTLPEAPTDANAAVLQRAGAKRSLSEQQERSESNKRRRQEQLQYQQQQQQPVQHVPRTSPPPAPSAATEAAATPLRQPLNQLSQSATVEVTSAVATESVAPAPAPAPAPVPVSAPAPAPTPSSAPAPPAASVVVAGAAPSMHPGPGGGYHPAPRMHMQMQPPPLQQPPQQQQQPQSMQAQMASQPPPQPQQPSTQPQPQQQQQYMAAHPGFIMNKAPGYAATATTATAVPPPYAYASSAQAVTATATPSTQPNVQQRGAPSAYPHYAQATNAPRSAVAVSKAQNYHDAILEFNRARGFPCRACTHISIARGIQMHMNATARSGGAAPVVVDQGQGLSIQQQQQHQQLQQQPPPPQPSQYAVQSYGPPMQETSAHAQQLMQQRYQMQLMQQQQAQGMSTPGRVGMEAHYQMQQPSMELQQQQPSLYAQQQYLQQYSAAQPQPPQQQYLQQYSASQQPPPPQQYPPTSQHPPPQQQQQPQQGQTQAQTQQQQQQQRASSATPPQQQQQQPSTQPQQGQTQPSTTPQQPQQQQAPQQQPQTQAEPGASNAPSPGGTQAANSAQAPSPAQPQTPDMRRQAVAAAAAAAYKGGMPSGPYYQQGAYPQVAYQHLQHPHMAAMQQQHMQHPHDLQQQHMQHMQQPRDLQQAPPPPQQHMQPYGMYAAPAGIYSPQRMMQYGGYPQMQMHHPHMQMQQVSPAMHMTQPPLMPPQQQQQQQQQTVAPQRSLGGEQQHMPPRM